MSSIVWQFSKKDITAPATIPGSGTLTAIDAAASSNGEESTDAEISGRTDEASTEVLLSTLPELNL
jgi:hypothetical protein